MKVSLIYNKKQADLSDVINIFGPQTREHYNPKTVERVASALEKGGHNVRVIEGNINVADSLRSYMPRVIAGERPGMVFNMAYGIQGYSRYTHIPAVLEMLGVPYVGSGPQEHAVALDKVMSKIIFRQHELSTPDFKVFSSPDEGLNDLKFPLIVKPKMEAVSMGLAVVNTEDELREAVLQTIETYQQQALVEEFIPGREFAVGLLGNGQDLEVLPIVEIYLGGDPDAIQTVDDKMKHPPQKICPPDIPPSVSDEMKRLARETFYALSLRDFARVDIRMDRDDNIYLLEVNSMASLGLTGSYVHAAKAAGYTFDGLVNRMLEVAAVRYFGEAPHKAPDDEEQSETKKQPLRVRLRRYLRGNASTIDEYIHRLVETNSFVHNVEGVNQLGEWIAGRLEYLGFNRKVFPQVEVGNILYFTNHPENINDILLLGHLDTYYGSDDYVTFREDRGHFYGPGVTESKGGLAVMLAAIHALRYSRRLKRIRCGVLLTTDDSIGGSFSKEIISDLAGKSGIVIGLKYGDLDGGVVTSCSGRKNFQIEMTNIKGGRQTKPVDVISTMCRKVTAWQKLIDEEQGISVRTNSVEGRSVSGLTPDYARAALFFQFRNEEQGEEVERKLREITHKGLSSRIRVRISRTAHRPPIVEDEGRSHLFNLVNRLASSLEINTQPVFRLNTSNLCYVPSDVPCLEGLGPVGLDVRTPNENILRDSLVERAALLALLINRSAKET
ncbi:M20/M25/M40 family metallo-hydrolase [candidate division KSB1 bacterium]